MRTEDPTGRIDRPEQAQRMYPLPEAFELLAACSWMAPVQEETAQKEMLARVLAQPVAWDAFLDLVQRHAVAPLVAERLERLAGPLVPESVQAKLKRSALAAWRHSMLLGHELSSLLERFQAAKIEVMPLKGSVLSSRLFGEPGLRHVSDIDLLVRDEDVPNAKQLLLEAGYDRSLPVRDLTPKQERVFRLHGHHYSFKRDGISVELHWRVFRWSDQETRSLWSHAVSTPWLGQEVAQPSDSFLLLILCDHGAQHRFSHLKWLADIVTLFASTEVQWPEVFELARRLDLELVLAQAVLLIDGVYPICLPQALLEFAKGQPKARLLADAAFAKLVGRDDSPVAPSSRRLGLRNLPHWFGQSVSLARYASSLRKHRPVSERFLPLAVGLSDFEAFPLPDRFFWMYYAFRPAFWAIRFLRGR